VSNAELRTRSHYTRTFTRDAADAVLPRRHRRRGDLSNDRSKAHEQPSHEPAHVRQEHQVHSLHC
jgi:hypothetical protein